VIGGTSRTVLEAVARLYRIDAHEIVGPSRSAEIARPRFVAYWLLRRVCGWSAARVGRTFGRDESTVNHGLRVIERARAAEPALAVDLEVLRARLGAERRIA
jgi:chromosomal replication initiator protein